MWIVVFKGDHVCEISIISTLVSNSRGVIDHAPSRDAIYRVSTFFDLGAINYAPTKAFSFCFFFSSVAFMLKKVVVFFLLILFPITLLAGDGEDYSGFHIGTVSGGGFAVYDGLMNRPAHLSFNIEVGYDFGNQIDVIGRFGYSPLIGTDDTVTINGVAVTPPNMIHIFNFGVGVRFIPISARFSPYFFTVLGAYNSRSNAAGSRVFASQTGFHNVDGFGLQFHATKHHLVGFETGTHIFINDQTNLTTIDFSVVYRYTF